MLITTTAHKPSICILPGYLYRRIPDVSNFRNNGCTARLCTRIECSYCVVNMALREWAFLSLLTFGPVRIFIATFLEAEGRILVIDPNLVSVVPAYDRDLRTIDSFSKTSAFDPGISESGFAQFLYDSQIICAIPVNSNSSGDPNKTCLDSRYEFHR